MTKTTKLELTWVGKENRPRLEPRILLEDATKSFHANARVSANDVFDNRLILGDNLLALKALDRELSGRVKCIYIDPPYNTGAALSHYDDSVEHSTWLSLIRERLEILWRLLSPDGSLWVSIDDYEVAYLRVLMDEVCGRSNFIATNVWQKRYSRENREAIGDVHEYILVYAKTPERFKAIRNRVPITEEQAKIYKNPNNDPKGRWRGIPMTAQGYRPNQMYPITTPTGVVHRPPEGRCWSTIEPEFEKLRREGRIWFGKDGSSQPSVIRYLSEVEGMVPWTWWPSDEVGHTDEAKKEIHELFGRADAFETPKPERLIERIIRIASNPGDLILDSFAGSGTTGAVAHKLYRRWIMVEVREQGQNLIVRRLRKVVEAKDQGGISGSIGWKGGGGFRCYNLAPSLLEKDKFKNWVISKQYNAAMLAEAMCKFEGFTYAPSDTDYWNHGYSTERDFIYVTTQTLTREQLQKLGDEIGENRSLLVCCSAFRVRDTSQFPNLTIKKIPKMVLNRCEWGRDDYSLEIKNLPQAAEPEPPPSSPVNGRKKRNNGSLDLFAAVGEKGVSGK